MKKLEIGGPGEPWKKEYEALLLNVIRSLYGGHLPYTYSPAEVVDEMSLYYCTDRSDNAIYEEIKSLLNKEGGVFKNIEVSKENKFFLVQEYSDAKYLDKRLFADKISHERRVKSETSISKRGKYIIYVFPSVPDADYGEIFASILKINHIAGPEFQKDVKKLFKINSKKWISIPITVFSKKTFSKLRIAIWVLLDLLLSKLTDDLAQSKRTRGTKNQQEMRVRKKDEINQILSFFRSYGYVFSYSRRLNKLLNTKSISIENVDTSILYTMMTNTRASKEFRIPEYSISMPLLFELYVYSRLALKNPNITIRYKPDYGKKIPDIVFSDKDLDECIIDVKYKFQYGRDDRYCEIDDVNRMFNYLSYKPEYQAKGLFCYPTLRQEKTVPISVLVKKRRLAKVSIALPVNRAL